MVRIIENYTLYEVIGEGAYGKVYRAINKVDNKQYAVKVIEVKKFQTNKKLEECTVHQINILTNIQKNKHIICYYDMLKTQNNFYFVYQYCNGGTLQGLLRKEQNLEEKKALLILKQLLQAFQVLNKYNIMHRDLKPDNIFFHNQILKVGDFGFCKSLEKAEMTKTMLGSPIYMAPEILNGQIYSNKADIWSIGVVLYEMLYGYCPFESNSIPKLIQVLKQTELDFPNDVQVSNQTKKLLQRILTKDPQKRVEWMELFQIKITNEGKLLEQGLGKLSLVSDDSKGLSKTIREVNEINEDSITSSSASTNSTNSSFSSNVKPYAPNTATNQNYNNYSSPKNLPAETFNRSQQQLSNDKAKMPFGRKTNPNVEQADPFPNSPLRSNRTNQNGLKDTVLKSHQQIVKGINIVRSMGLNNQKSTPIFSYYLFKAVTDRLKKLKDEQLSNVQNMQVKQYRQIIDQQVGEMEFETNQLKSKVEEFADWKKAMKAKILDVKNIRLCYELVMFLSGEPSNESILHNQMSYVIRTKIAS